MTNIDLLIRNGHVLTMENDREILKEHTIGVHKDEIVFVKPSKEAEKEYTATTVIEATGQYVLPGFVNTHAHLFQNMFKGVGRGLPLLKWLNAGVRKGITVMDYESIHTAATAGLLENIRSGVTTILDYMYCHGIDDHLDEAVIDAFIATGIRGVLGRGYTDSTQFPDTIACPYNETEADFFNAIDRLAQKTEHIAKVTLAIAPGIIWDISEKGLLTCRAYANKYKIPITLHLVESKEDNEFCLVTHNMRTIPYLEKMGILGPDFIAVHCVDITSTDIDILAKHNVKVSHNAISNLIIGYDFSPVIPMKEKGIIVGIATDGAASNDCQNMLEVLKITALIHKSVHQDPEVMDQWEILKMATIDGATVLGKENEIGSIKVGKKADLIVFNPDTLASVPCNDPAAAIVYATETQSIRDVIIGGQVIIKDNQFLQFKETEVIDQVKKTNEKIRRRIDLNV